MTKNMFYWDFQRYYWNAWRIEQAKLGNTTDSYMQGFVKTGDVFMDTIPVYDSGNRYWVLITKVLRDVWDNRHLKDHWNLEEWLYLFMVHRITGSGSSFDQDHGYKNTIIPQLAELQDMNEMVEWIYNFEGAMYTSIGCQIPAFPKLDNPACMPHLHDYKSLKKSGQGKLYLCTLLPQLIKQIATRIKKSLTPHREIIDMCSTFNRSRGFNSFTFQYSLFSADCSDFFPQLVDHESRVYWGTNSRKAVQLMTPKGSGSILNRMDDIVDEFIVDFKKSYGIDIQWKSVEATACDYYKYLKEWVPDYYAHLGQPRRDFSIVPQSIIIK